MRERSKRYKAFKTLIDFSKHYAIEEAIDLVKKTANTKFDASVEVHLRLGIDPKKADQLVRGSVSLPHGTGKKKIIAVFAEGKDQELAKKAGAEIVGSDELIKDIKTSGKCNFEIAIATPEMMKKLGQIAKILGPKGLMPNPKNETIAKDVGKTVKELSGGKVTFRNDDSGNIHQMLGKASFATKKLLENFNVFLEAVRRAKPAAAKGVYIQNVSLSSTMGPGIKVNV
jgi:large subunit ribosomal protein L1